MCHVTLLIKNIYLSFTFFFWGMETWSYTSCEKFCDYIIHHPAYSGLLLWRAVSGLSAAGLTESAAKHHEPKNTSSRALTAHSWGGKTTHWSIRYRLINLVDTERGININLIINVLLLCNQQVVSVSIYLFSPSV